MTTSNAEINVKNGRSLNYPFDLLNYQRRIVTIKRNKQVTNDLGEVVTIEVEKDVKILNPDMPYHIKNAIGGFKIKTTLGYIDVRDRPTNRLGKKNQNLTRVLTPKAMELIKKWEW